MGFQSVSNTAEARLFYNVDSGPDIINTLHFRDDINAWDGAALSDLCNQVHGWWTAEVAALQHVSCVLQKIVARDLEAEFGFQFELNVGEPGTRSGAAAPAAIAAKVKWTGDPGQAPRRGGLYHPGVCEADIDANLLTQAYADDVKSAYDGARSMGGAPISQAFVLLSRYHGHTLVNKPDGTVVKKPTLRTPVGVTNTIGDTVVTRRYSIQKRRRPSPL